jgi:protein-disulfide isomerase
MATKRVDSTPTPSGPGRGRKPGAVKASKKESSNRAFYLLIAAIAVVGIGWLAYQSTRSNEVVQASPIDTTLPKVASEGYVLGSPTARLEVTEFGDFECPACGHFATITEPDIRKKFVGSGLVRWRFIDYPLSVHKNTWQASRAAACADEQGRFWDFHDYLYQTQDQWNGEATDNPDKFMKQAARQLGLDAGKFDQCVDSKKYQAKIQAHLALGDARKINSTPTFIIGSSQVARVMTYDQMAQIINDELAKAPAAPTPGGDSGRAVALPAAKKKAG